MIPTCFCDDYVVPTRSRSMLKLGYLAQTLASRGLATLVDPGILDTDLLYKLHDPAYVDAFLNGEKPLAISQNLPWSDMLRSAVLAMQAGQLKAASIAMEHGIAANLANGFHHAKYARGGGFCTFNGLALTARAFPKHRVFVLDCDEHGGNGTEDFTERLPNLHTYSIFGKRFGCIGGPRSVADSLEAGPFNFFAYQQALERAFSTMSDWKPDLVVYQAGVDCHQQDPIGRGFLSASELKERDRLVFEYCRRHSIPVVFTMAGGYHELEQVAELHANTFVSASATQFLPSPTTENAKFSL